MKSNVLYLAICILFCAHLIGEEITLAADPWLPFNGVKDQGDEGFVLEIAREVFKQKGITIKYENMPWARAISMAKQGKIHGIIGALKSDAPDFIFPEKEQAMSGISIFTLKSNPWKYEGVESLSKIIIGAILDYSYGKDVDDYIEGHKESGKVEIIAGETGLDLNIEKLKRNRIQGLLEDQSVFFAKIKSLGMNKDDFNQFSVKASEKTYIAFSPALANSKHYAEILSQGMTEIRSNGKLKEILAKYGLTDWAQQQ